jgi:molybdate transport system substrate-binding protein
VDALDKEGLIDAASRRVIAGNELVLIAPTDSRTVGGFSDLADPKVKRIAIGEPKTVPAGQYAVQTLQSLKLHDTLKGRLIYGANVRQVLYYVERGEVDAGLVYATDAKLSGDKVRIVATADPKLHDPIEYPAVILKEAKERKSAERFLDHLSSRKAQAIFRDAGFSIPPAKAAEERK